VLVLVPLEEIMRREIVDAQDHAHVIVTHLVNRDREAAGDEWDSIIRQGDQEMFRVALVLSDLSAYLVHKLAAETFREPSEVWAEIATEVAAWREE
jgi:hypothetical protein